jgi:hypothetical protein
VGFFSQDKLGEGMPTDFENSIVSPALKIVAAHWLAARRGRETPAWAALMPTAIKAQLPIVWSYTYDPGSALFTGRLAGERVTGLFGNNFRGLPMSEAHPKDHCPVLFAKCKKALTEPALYHGTGMVFITSEQYVQVERIIMPLSSDGITGDGIFGATDIPLFAHDEIPELNFDGEIGRWFSPQGTVSTI